MDERAVVTGFLRNRAEILLARRSEEVGSYRGKWGAVAGHSEGNPAASIRREIDEETGIDPERCELVRSGDPFVVEDPDLDRRWIVHPYLFDCPTRSVTLDWEHTTCEWTAPTEIRRRETVPELWRSYDVVRPTAGTISSNREHGSATLSIRALEVLRDEAGLLTTGGKSEFDDIEAVARTLLDARPAMTVVANRIHRAMQSVAGGPGNVEASAREEIQRALEADTRAAKHLAEWIDSRPVATLSRSGTVLQALRDGEPTAVLLPESRPGGEGVAVAESLAPEIDVTLTNDAAFAHYLTRLDDGVLVVGADSILPDGSVLNKAGTRAAAAAATRADIPVVVAAATDKVRPATGTDPGLHRDVELEPRPASELYDGPAPITVENPTFDLTPPSDIDAVLTEQGEVGSEGIERLARAHGERRDWN